jgi:hypothetical protein
MSGENGHVEAAPAITHEEIVQRNFGLTKTQDEWLRERAYRRDLNGRSSKAELVRDAIDAFIAQHAAA